MNAFDRTAFKAGIIGALVVMLFIVVGSRYLADFDWALTTYAVGSIFAAFAVVYRYAVWAQRPPTRMYLRRGIQAFFARKRGWSSTPKNTGSLLRLLLDNFVLQRFITRRSRERWIMHACLSWGGMLAFAVTFPLVFGWIHFESAR
jgi:O-antigen/teichoic acid export membrane protein